MPRGPAPGFGGRNRGHPASQPLNVTTLAPPYSASAITRAATSAVTTTHGWTPDRMSSLKNRPRMQIGIVADDIPAQPIIGVFDIAFTTRPCNQALRMRNIARKVDHYEEASVPSSRR